MSRKAAARTGGRGDRVWRALASPARRAVLDLLRTGPRTTGEVAAILPGSRFAAMKHLAVLVGAGLVAVERRGRERWNALRTAAMLREIRRWERRYAGGRRAATAASTSRGSAASPARRPARPRPPRG
ncbi:MAG: helix-turn-helix domain-containing protein [Planctomycetes bacterium]|nr:helix-turn-helix domain-containing protein [Planctomycetota bacterium]